MDASLLEGTWYQMPTQGGAVCPPPCAPAVAWPPYAPAVPWPPAVRRSLRAAAGMATLAVRGVGLAISGILFAVVAALCLTAVGGALDALAAPPVPLPRVQPPLRRPASPAAMQLATAQAQNYQLLHAAARRTLDIDYGQPWTAPIADAYRDSRR